MDRHSAKYQNVTPVDTNAFPKGVRLILVLLYLHLRVVGVCVCGAEGGESESISQKTNLTNHVRSSE